MSSPLDFVEELTNTDFASTERVKCTTERGAHHCYKSTLVIYRGTITCKSQTKSRHAQTVTHSYKWKLERISILGFEPILVAIFRH